MEKTQEAKMFLAKVRKRVRELKICLTPTQFVKVTQRKLRCCALGASLALKAKTKKELIALADAVPEHFNARPEFVATVLNGGTSMEDMFQLECGFEDWEFHESPLDTDPNHPFYIVGKKLRADADKAAK